LPIPNQQETTPRSIPTLLKFRQVKKPKIVEMIGKGGKVLNPIPYASAPATAVTGNCGAEEVGKDYMQDHLSAEAQEDAEERLAEKESPRVFTIAAGLKEIKRARVLVEKGKVKERESEKKGQWEHEVS